MDGLRLLDQRENGAAKPNVQAEHSVAFFGDISHSTITIGSTPKELGELVRANSEADSATIEKLAKEIGVTQGAVTTFLGVLGEKNVPLEQLPSKLGEIAERHKALLTQIGAFRPPALTSTRSGSRPRLQSSMAITIKPSGCSPKPRMHSCARRPIAPRCGRSTR